MRFSPDRRSDLNANNLKLNILLTAIYPGLYCPRCSSREIGLRMFFNGEGIWGCRDCGVEFRLIFPDQNRF